VWERGVLQAVNVVVEVVKAVAWPMVAVFALYLLRRPLVELVAQIASRASKFSLYNVSVELAVLPELSASWTVGSTDVRKLTSSLIFDSPSQALFQELLKPGKADYAVIDLGHGREWLSSRLYIFALVLGEVRGLRAFVFLESASGNRRRFLGVATPANIQRGLSETYPWLEEAYFRAATGNPQAPAKEETRKTTFWNRSPSLFRDTNQLRLSNFVRQFIDTIQRTTAPPLDEQLRTWTWENNNSYSA
jgi:hypothetical protein